MAAESGSRSGEEPASGERRSRHSPDAGRLGVRGHAKRLALASALALLSINVWTGGPLLALWIGSRVQGSGPPSMAAVGAVVASLALVTLVMVRVLAGVGHAYDTLVGRPRGPREPAPWMRSLRSERSSERAERAGLSLPERIAVLSVVVAVVAFEVWFFFFSGSPIGGGSGR